MYVSFQTGLPHGIPWISCSNRCCILQLLLSCCTSAKRKWPSPCLTTMLHLQKLFRLLILCINLSLNAHFIGCCFEVNNKSWLAIKYKAFLKTECSLNSRSLTFNTLAPAVHLEFIMETSCPFFSIDSRQSKKGLSRDWASPRPLWVASPTVVSLLRGL